MFLDWIAAGERHEDGDIHESIEIHYQSGRISKQTAEIMRNTADTLEDMGAIENKDES
jgi:hypothetical protein